MSCKQQRRSPEPSGGGLSIFNVRKVFQQMTLDAGKPPTPGRSQSVRHKPSSSAHVSRNTSLKDLENCSDTELKGSRTSLEVPGLQVPVARNMPRRRSSERAPRHTCDKLVEELQTHMPFVDYDVEWMPAPDEIALLRSTWMDDSVGWWKFQRGLGEDIYAYIFHNTNDVKRMFPEAAAYGGHWKNNPRFRRQALRFVQVLDDVINSLEKPDELDQLLYNVGTAHVRYASRGFHAGMWKVFKDAVEVAMDKRVRYQQRQLQLSGSDVQSVKPDPKNQIYGQMDMSIVEAYLSDMDSQQADTVELDEPNETSDCSADSTFGEGDSASDPGGGGARCSCMSAAASSSCCSDEGVYGGTCSEAALQRTQRARKLWSRLSIMIVQKVYVGFAEGLVAEYCSLNCTLKTMQRRGSHKL